MFLTFLGPPTSLMIYSTSLMIYSTVNHQKLPFSDPTHPPLWWRNTWIVPYQSPHILWASEASSSSILKNLIRDHSSITSSKRWVGGVRKWQFLMIYSTVDHQRGGWVGLKKPKTWWRNTWMPPNLPCHIRLEFPLCLSTIRSFPFQRVDKAKSSLETNFWNMRSSNLSTSNQLSKLHFWPSKIGKYVVTVVCILVRIQPF